MQLKRFFLSALMIGVLAISASAGAGKEAILKARSESGQAALLIKVWDMDGPLSKAQLVMNNDTINLDIDCDSYSVIDLPNHILTICFQEKGKPADASGAKSVKVWATPSSFVKMPNGEYNWRFKIKVNGSMLKETIKMDGTFEWNP